MNKRVFFKKCLLCLAAVLVAFSKPSLAQDSIRGDTVAPYPVIGHGIKLTFPEIDKQYLGRKCTVFYKPGRQDMGPAFGPPDPDGMVIHRDNVLIVNGELYGLSKHELNIVWFIERNGWNGRSWFISDQDIDYVLVEGK